MLSANKVAFRIIGLFAIISSIAFFVINVSELGKLASVENFIYQVVNLTINCIGIYGGFQLMQFRKVGHQLLIIWSSCRGFTAILVILMLVANLFFMGNNQFVVPVPVLRPLIMAYYIFSPVVLVYLLASRASRDLLLVDNPRYMRIVFRLLSLLTPGLSRALIGNLLAGILLFYVYSGIMLYAQFGGVDEWHLGSFHFATPESWINFLGKVTVWIVFAGLDWDIVKKYENAQKEKLLSDLQS